jgi:RND family efflux transporter MFP subunit
VAEVPVSAATVHRAAHTAIEEVVGTVRPQLRALLEAKLTARIEEMRVVQGQAVKSGELLARLDVREIQARLDQAVAQREQAELDLQRFSNLITKQAVTRQEYDAAQARARVTRAAVTEIETLMGFGVLTAPFDGIVARKLADVGDLAAPGKPLLELQDPTHLRIEAEVPESLITFIRPGQSIPVRISTLNSTLHGRVSEIAPASDPGSRTFLVKLELPATDGLREGLFGRVTLPVGEYQAVRVPEASVVRRGQMEMVFVVDQGHARLRLVRSGRHVAGEIEITAGLSGEETLVTSGAAGLLDGQPVKIQP